MICRPDDHAPAVEALVEHFLARRNEWDVFRWAGLRHPVDTYATLRPRCAFVAREDLPDYVIELPGSWEDLRRRVSSNMRRKLRKAYKSLERDAFAFRLHVTEKSHGVEAAMHRFLTLHTARAEATGTIIHENKFERPHMRAFLAEHLNGAAERGELRIFELEIGGNVVASRLAFLLGSDMWMHLSGYDPAWKNYSVMTVLTTEMIKWALAYGSTASTCLPVATSRRLAGGPARCCSVTRFRYRRRGGPELRWGRSAPTRRWAEPGGSRRLNPNRVAISLSTRPTHHSPTLRDMAAFEGSKPDQAFTKPDLTRPPRRDCVLHTRAGVHVRAALSLSSAAPGAANFRA